MIIPVLVVGAGVLGYLIFGGSKTKPKVEPEEEPGPKGAARAPIAIPKAGQAALKVDGHGTGMLTDRSLASKKAVSYRSKQLGKRARPAPAPQPRIVPRPSPQPIPPQPRPEPQPIPPEPQPEPTGPVYARVITSQSAPLGDLKIRSSPGGTQTGGAAKSSLVEVLNWNAGSAGGYEWAEVRAIDKAMNWPATQGYAAKQFLKMEPSKAAVNMITGR